MCSLVRNVSVKYWQSCVFGDLNEADNNAESWVSAFDYALHRGVDVQQLLEGWTTDVVH